MRYDFDTLVDRHNTSCIKWDYQECDFGTNGLIPFWIADSDFVVSDYVIDSMKKRIEHSIFGYSDIDIEYRQAVTKWFAKRHGWDVKEDMIVPTSGIVPSISFAIEILTQSADKILIQSPVYDPFFSIVKSCNRTLVENKLLVRDGKYYMDFEDLEKKLADGVKMMILCSPHNPVGRVWTFDELRKVASLCLKYNVYLVSDEIHCDIVYKGHKHTTMGLFEELEELLIVCTAPSKSFNLAGLQTSNIIIPSGRIRGKYLNWLYSRYMFCPNILGITACKAAYTYGEDWLDEQLLYLESNADFAVQFFKDNMPEVKIVKPEGTYLMWADFTAFGYSSDELVKQLAQKQGLAVGNGAHYERQANGFIRINIACPRSMIEAGLVKIMNFVNEIKK